MNEQQPQPGETRNETGRIEAFSDGVFAIAITLLILDIHVPSASPAGLGVALLRQWPVYLAFLTSFATIGIMWINHHRLFTLIACADDGLLALNMLLLLGIIVVPFPTALVADFIEQPDGRVAALVYNGTFVFIAIVFNLLWHYAAHGRRLLGNGADPAAVRAISRQYAVGPVFYLLAAGLACLSVGASVALNLILAVYFALPQRLLPLRG